ncbi:MAG: hypothetical protein FWG75_02600 [Cystobacterineae bacterium]|nr:hypothetical protein [Cystobacterineae bacterium]
MFRRIFNSKIYDRPNSSAVLPIQDIIYIHEAKLSDSPCEPAIASELTMTLDVGDFQINATQGLTSKPFTLKAGRYLFDMDFTEKGKNNEMFVGVRPVGGGEKIFRYYAYAALLADSCRR